MSSCLLYDQNFLCEGLASVPGIAEIYVTNRRNLGYWYYLDNNGRMKTGWIKSEGKWYYLDSSSGKMLTRWIEDNGKWYYLNSSGEMRIGWLEENGNLFYLNDSGEMVKNAYIDSYYFESNGAGKKTWHNKEDNRSR